MPSIDPSKIFVVLVVALIVLGPDKLPRLARQLGEAWAHLTQWRQRLETEVRDVFPDLPAPGRIMDAARSPLRLLDQLASEHLGTADVSRPPAAATATADPSERGVPATPAPGAGPTATVAPELIDDPSMN